MTDAIAKPQDFESIVRDKIRKVLFDSIPDEQIDTLIKAQYAKLFEKSRDRYDNVQDSEFNRMVNTEIQKTMTIQIKETVERCFKEQWTQELSDRILEDVVKKFATSAIAGLAQDLVAMSLNNFRNQLTQRI